MTLTTYPLGKDPRVPLSHNRPLRLAYLILALLLGYFLGQFLPRTRAEEDWGLDALRLEMGQSPCDERFAHTYLHREAVRPNPS